MRVPFTVDKRKRTACNNERLSGLGFSCIIPEVRDFRLLKFRKTAFMLAIAIVPWIGLCLPRTSLGDGPTDDEKRSEGVLKRLEELEALIETRLTPYIVSSGTVVVRPLTVEGYTDLNPDHSCN